MMLSLILLIATPWLAFCMPPPTSTTTLPPPPTTTPPMCTCSDGTQIAPGEYHSISDCHTCYCDDNYHEAQEMMADCLPSNCVDPVDVPGQCCDSCPNGANCKADFIDINGKPRSELISARDGVVDFGTARCKCDYNNFYDGEPRAICELMPPTTLPAMCTCSDGTQVQPGQSVWITPCRGCYCDDYNLEAYEMIVDCFMTPCVDSVRKPDQCCPECPNGHNCRAEFVDEYGVKRNEIISVSDGVVKFNSTECQCDYNNYHGEPKALCVLTLSIEPVTAEQTTIP